MTPPGKVRMQAASPTSHATGSHTAAREILSFKLGDEEYGMDILRVQEIRSYEAPTRIANAPSFVRGVLNLRGVIVPIVDLRVKFGLEPRFEAVTVTVVLNVAGRTVGAVVDSVSDVLQLAADQIKPPPQFTSAIDASHIIGLGSVKHGDAERLLILLDIERLMSSADMGLVEPLAA
jgi:purine-binding chemotaxis protein CheW